MLIHRTVISKPKEIASYLLKQKFGSADNIPHAINRDADGTHSAGHYHGSANIPPAALEARYFYLGHIFAIIAVD